MPKCVKSLCLLMLAMPGLSAAAGWDPNNFTPDNAAYWYHKAFDLYEDPNSFDLAEYATGDMELTPQIEQYLTRQQPVIDLLQKATEIEHCDWQFDPLTDGKYSPSPYLSDAKDAAFLLLADGRYQEIKYPDTSIETLFEPVFQLVSHIDSSDTINHLLALAIRITTFNDIHEYLNRHPDMQLTDLYKAQQLLRNESARQTITYKDTISRSIENTERILTDYKRYVYSDHFLVKQMGIPADKLSETFYRRNLQFYHDYMNKFQSYLDLPYPEACQKIIDSGEELKAKARVYFMEYREQIKKKLNDFESQISPLIVQNKLTSDNIPNFEQKLLAEIDIEHLEKCDFLYSLFNVPQSPLMLSMDTRIRTKSNALKAGTLLLIRYRKTNTIPDNLQSFIPKDLFSEKPFLIIKTTDGFMLKCQGKDLGDDEEIHEYTFKLPN